MNLNLRVHLACSLAFILGAGIASWCDARPTDAQATLPTIIGPHEGSPTATSPLSSPFTETTADGPTARFQELLAKGLKLRRPQEKEFVARIAVLVEQRILPRSLVTTSFSWARKRHQKFPYPYFQRAIVLRSAKLGVRLNAQGMLVP